MDKQEIESSKAKPGRVAQEFTKAATDFEKSKIDELKLSRKIAWGVAGGAVVMALLCGLTALVAILLRTEPEPVVLKVATDTGATTVMRSTRDADDHFDEVVNKYWLGQYVRTCEGYDWFTISTQYDSCNLMSSSSVGKEYSAKVKAPGSPLNVLKDRGRISVQVTSIVFVGDTAQVRFTSQKLSPSGENSDNSPLQKWIATIAYEFKPKQQMTEQQKQVNPLGLQVASYRVDPEASK
jgi:type IV secretion system protein VirB8